MRIGVLLNSQTVDSLPRHTISAILAERFLNHRHNGKKACVPVTENRIKIVVDVTFERLKRLLKGRACYDSAPTASRDYPVLSVTKRRQWNQGLLIHYPLQRMESGSAQ